MSQLAPLLDHLVTLKGTYRGSGRTTDGFAFDGELVISARVRDAVVELAFRAVDKDSAFHEEATWIANDLMTNRPALWTVSTNTPGVLRHDLNEDSALDGGLRRLVFRLNEPTDTRRFRQEITLEIAESGELTYLYAWGVPHEEMKPRVRANLRRV